jgi:hypothetical protein
MINWIKNFITDNTVYAWSPWAFYFQILLTFVNLIFLFIDVFILHEYVSVTFQIIALMALIFSIIKSHLDFNKEQ